MHRKGTQRERTLGGWWWDSGFLRMGELLGKRIGSQKWGIKRNDSFSVRKGKRFKGHEGGLLRTFLGELSICFISTGLFICWGRVRQGLL